MASIFELGAIPGGLLPRQMKLTTVTNGITLSTDNSYTVIVHGTPGAGGATYTTATAAAIIAHIGGDCAVGTTYMMVVLNFEGTGNVITVKGGSGVNVSGVATIGAKASKIFIGRVTNVTKGSEAITLFGLGETAAATAN